MSNSRASVYPNPSSREKVKENDRFCFGKRSRQLQQHRKKLQKCIMVSCTVQWTQTSTATCTINIRGLFHIVTSSSKSVHRQHRLRVMEGVQDVLVDHKSASESSFRRANSKSALENTQEGLECKYHLMLRPHHQKLTKRIMTAC